MAFNFLGTFTQAEFQALMAYAVARLPQVEARIAYLKAQMERLGWVEYTLDENGERIAYRVLPPESLMAKYVKVYEYYGGNLLDTVVRSRGDWVYLTKGDFDLSDSAPYTGGRPSDARYPAGSRYLGDAVPGTHVAKVKDWLIPSLKRGLEDAEFRVKRTADLSDQCIEEIVLLIKRSTGADNLEDLRKDVEYFVESAAYPSAKP